MEPVDDVRLVDVRSVPAVPLELPGDRRLHCRQLEEGTGEVPLAETVQPREDERLEAEDLREEREDRVRGDGGVKGDVQLADRVPPAGRVDEAKSVHERVVEDDAWNWSGCSDVVNRDGRTVPDP